MSDTVTWTTPSEVEVAMTRTFNAPQALVFDAFTRPEHVVHWMLGPEGWTMPVCEIDLREGGAWHMVWRREDGREMAMSGKYLEVAPHSRTVQTESWGPGWPETVNTTEFTASGERTTVVHTVRFPSREARDRALETGMRDGATASYERLAEYLVAVVA
ncbi:SRPBCC family protein [Saccharothrix syringae]|uniref:ATPase n=1 Tax=Saccharothrix syringae TaxID=103733 RepID=A0A5Q0HB93_SACSY|nr:SRPBCC family protein [Saccharothrix syringae]QFZ23234.1 ATPase [Saccharothrix syringae]